VPQQSKSSLSREAILDAFQKMSDELGRRGTTGEPYERHHFSHSPFGFEKCRRGHGIGCGVLSAEPNPDKITISSRRTFCGGQNMNPKTLAEVAEFTAQGESFDFCLRNFLDGFYGSPDETALQAEPQSLAKDIPRFGEIEDAYLAATAEWLAWKFNLPPPRWIFDKTRSLHRPWFASPLAALRAVLLIESPAPFRSRNLFVSENALSRA
jgi:hypothetical protein